jgi:hypothetical protein
MKNKKQKEYEWIYPISEGRTFELTWIQLIIRTLVLLIICLLFGLASYLLSIDHEVSTLELILVGVLQVAILFIAYVFSEGFGFTDWESRLPYRREIRDWNNEPKVIGFSLPHGRDLLSQSERRERGLED